MNPDLMALLGQRVTVTNPSIGTTWTGKLVAVGHEPCVTIDQDRGPRLCLPQSFVITRADDTPPTPKSSAQWERLAIREPNGDVTYTWPDVPPTATGHVTGARVHGLIDRQLDRLGETLFNSIDKLEQHIEQRAAELAQPLIYDAREDAATQVKTALDKQQRAEDLLAELRRQLKASDRNREHYQHRAEAAEAATARVRQLHAKTPHNPGTCYCANPYPCPTIRALDGQEPDHA